MTTRRTHQMKTILLLAACIAALSGCAATETAIRAKAVPGFGAGVRTYALANASGPASNDAADAAGHEDGFARAVARRLAELGFSAAPESGARYRVALSYETRPAGVGVVYADCADGAPCGVANPAPGFEWPGAKAFVHSLTLRFFDRADGREVYKVSAAKRDRDPLGTGDIDDLVAGALARLPFAEPLTEPLAAGGSGASLGKSGMTDWKVTLSKAATDAAPRVTRIAPLPR